MDPETEMHPKKQIHGPTPVQRSDRCVDLNLKTAKNLKYFICLNSSQHSLNKALETFLRDFGS